MPVCLTCHRSTKGFQFTCPACNNSAELVEIKRVVGDAAGNLSKIEEMAAHTAATREVLERMEKLQWEYLPKMASAIEWGFEELSWQLQQQTDILRSIDHKLVIPRQIEAKELRRMGEQLRLRGEASQAERFLTESLEKNPLDYRTYIALAKTNLELGSPVKAQAFLENSLTHAPSPALKSYSLRLLGHLYACADDYRQALALLRHALELSPEYLDGHYDYSQYAGNLRMRDLCLVSLTKAVVGNPLYWYLAQKERHFDPVRPDVAKLLMGVRTDAANQAQQALVKLDRFLGKAKVVLDEAIDIHRACRKATPHTNPLESRKLYQVVDDKRQHAAAKLGANDYKANLEAHQLANDCRALVDQVIQKAEQELDYYERRLAEHRSEQQRRNATHITLAIIGAILAIPFLFCLGCMGMSFVATLFQR